MYYTQRRTAAILSLILGLALSIGGVRPAHAQLSFTLSPTAANVTGPSTLTFTGTLINNGASNLFLNQDAFSFSAPGATLDDTDFFTNVPASLTPGQAISVPIFTITFTSLLPANTFYPGTFTIQGGASSTVNNNLASQSFRLTAPPSVPEAGTVPALAAGLACLTLLALVQRRRRMSNRTSNPSLT